MRLDSKKDTEIIKNSLAQSHEYVTMVVKEGDTVVDATAGNGNDTLFLARLVGEKGRVYSFDIQSCAIERTREKLEKEGLTERVTLINDSHHNMDLYIEGKVRTIMFNLGYLPGGDHNIDTKADSTEEALNKAMDIIEKNGLISMVVYYGGDSGFDEKNHIMDYIKHIDSKRFTVMATEFVNQVNCPPILVCIEKLF
ncbi:MAG: class I SAM-dependent methyltransferase [Bacillota bacterium]|nr:class I SAM-dependent methyltransferase [Bacillota bacterium]